MKTLALSTLKSIAGGCGECGGEDASYIEIETPIIETTLPLPEEEVIRRVLNATLENTQ